VGCCRCRCELGAALYSEGVALKRVRWAVMA
jgi:hypothetical protein